MELQYFPKGWISAIENRDFSMVLILQLGKYLKGKTENEWLDEYFSITSSSCIPSKNTLSLQRL